MFSFLLQRIRYRWQLLVTVSLGVFLATILLASAPILLQTVIEFGLQRNLLTAPALDGNVQLSAFPDEAPSQAVYEAYAAEMTALIANRLGWVSQQVIPVLELRWLFPWQDEAILENEVVFVRAYSDLPGRITFLAGDWPNNVIVDPQNGVLAAIIGQEMAEAYNLQVGDRLPLSQERGEEQPRFWLEISGIARPVDPLDPYWFGDLSPFRSQSSSRWATEYSAIIPAGDFLAVNQQLFNYRPTFLWRVLLDPGRITYTDIPRLRQALSQLDNDLRGRDFRPALTSGLDGILDNFSQQTAAIRPPLYLLTLEVVLLALYYVTMVGALAVREIEGEFAVLRSRGASLWHIYQMQAGEALLISLAALLSGPGLAALLVRALAIFGPIGDVAQVNWGLSLPAGAWLAAGVGATVSAATLLLPVGPAIQRSVVTQRQLAVRDTRPGWWQRTYLDILLLTLGLLLLWRLKLAGGIAAGGSQTQVDWLLLLSPLLLLLGSGTILLRLFPLLLRFLAYLAASRPGLPAALALWQAARNPTHIARLVLLLTLAMALGLLATGLNATLDQSEFERAFYEAGGDVQIKANNVPMLTPEGVAAAAQVGRMEGAATIGRTFFRYNVLGVEPISLSQVSLFRADFADQPMGELLGQLATAPEPLPSLTLPGQPGQIGLWVWARPDDPQRQVGGGLLGVSDLERFGLLAKLQTPAGQLFTVRLQPVIDTIYDGQLSTILLKGGSYPAGGWRYFVAEIPPLATYPLQLHSLWFQNRARNAGGFVPVPLFLAIDDLTITDQLSGQQTILTSFEESSPAWQINDGRSYARPDTTTVHSGSGRLNLGLSYARSLQWVGLHPAGQPRTLPNVPALANNTFIQQTGATIGDTFPGRIDSLPVNFVIVGRLNYFPTLEDQNDLAGYLVASRDPLLVNLNEHSYRPYNSNELFVAADGSQPISQLSSQLTGQLSSFKQLTTAETIAKTIKADPMALGLRSTTWFGYLLTTWLSLVGFATYFYMSARRQTASYAVLRSMGMSAGQLYGTLALEQIVLILCGLAIGTVLGLLLNQLILPGLPITLGDRPPIPPFIARNDWLAVGRIYLSLAMAFLLVLGLATWLLWRTQLHRVLRIGEE